MLHITSQKVVDNLQLLCEYPTFPSEDALANLDRSAGIKCRHL